MPGPVPKRSEDRIRRNVVEIDKVQAFGVVSKPKLGLQDPHPIIVDFWDSVGESAQTRYYEKSDWQYLRIALHFLDRLLKSKGPSAQMLTVVNQMLVDLLVTEGSRRRVRMEIEREAPNEGVTDVADYFRALAEKNDLGDIFKYQ
jgi:hypothetical protein